MTICHFVIKDSNLTEKMCDSGLINGVQHRETNERTASHFFILLHNYVSYINKVEGSMSMSFGLCF